MQDMEHIWKQIAREDNTTVENVRAEIQRAIDAAMADPDPTIQRKWAAIPSKTGKPTPEELLVYIVKKTRG